MSSLPDLRTDVLLHGELTGGRVSVTEVMVPPHISGPPLHTHGFDEAFYVLEGELTFQVGDALVSVEPPEWALGPIPEVTVVGPPIAAQATSA